MSRTFQNLQVCMNMSAIENVMVGAHLTLNSSLFAGMIRLPQPAPEGQGVPRRSPKADEFRRRRQVHQEPC